MEINDHLACFGNRLFEGVRQGKKEAFEALFNCYYELLNAYAVKFVTRQDAEEIAQDTLLQVWQMRETLVIEASFEAYLYRAVYYRILNTMKSNEARHRAYRHFCEEHQDFSPEFMDDRRPELLEDIRCAIRSLPESYRTSFIMHRFKEMTYKEISHALCVSPQTVNYRICKALKLLRNELKEVNRPP
jgi:RNA polymerase sigma-70 factor (ECF subfamily)